MLKTTIIQAPSDQPLIETLRAYFASIPQLVKFQSLIGEVDLYSIAVVLRARHGCEFGPTIIQFQRSPDEQLRPVAAMRFRWPDVAMFVWGYIPHMDSDKAGYWVVQLDTPDTDQSVPEVEAV